MRLFEAGGGSDAERKQREGAAGEGVRAPREGGMAPEKAKRASSLRLAYQQSWFAFVDTGVRDVGLSLFLWWTRSVELYTY